MTAVLRYPGTELELFQRATQWKAYLAQQIRPFLGSHVLEVGAGIGATTKILCSAHQTRWVMLEPDPELAAQLVGQVAQGRLSRQCQVTVGTIQHLPDQDRYDSVLYIDVLEHIREDRQELALAVKRLRPGGYLIVLSPAHQWLYSPFDEAIGHCRRYDRHTLAATAPPTAQLLRMRYLDAAGLLASLANAMLLRRAAPTTAQVLFWDRILVPASRVLDRCFRYRVGKSVLGIWRV